MKGAPAEELELDDFLCVFELKPFYESMKAVRWKETPWAGISVSEPFAVSKELMKEEKIIKDHVWSSVWLKY